MAGHKRDYGYRGLGFCALGSMREVLGNGMYSMQDGETELNKKHREYPKAKRALKKVMIEQLEPDMALVTSAWIIPMLNDRNGRTQEEIVACMRKAANNLEA